MCREVLQCMSTTATTPLKTFTAAVTRLTSARRPLVPIPTSPWTADASTVSSAAVTDQRVPPPTSTARLPPTSTLASSTKSLVAAIPLASLRPSTVLFPNLLQRAATCLYTIISLVPTNHLSSVMSLPKSSVVMVSTTRCMAAATTATFGVPSPSMCTAAPPPTSMVVQRVMITTLLISISTPP